MFVDESSQFRSQFLMIEPPIPFQDLLSLRGKTNTIPPVLIWVHIRSASLSKTYDPTIKNKCMNLILFASQSKRSPLDYMSMMYDLWLLKFQLLFSDVKISGQAASKCIDLLSDRCNYKGQTNCKGKCINNYHWSTVVGRFLLGTRSVAFSTHILICVTRPL